MKKHVYLIFFNIIFLIVLLYIQVNWIIRVAEKEEALFSQKVKMALAQTVNDLRNDTLMCSQMECCYIQKNPSSNGYYSFGKNEIKKFNSLIEKNLKKLDVNLSYDFDIINNSSNINEVLGNNIYSQNLENALNKAGLHIRINFPNKSKFIISQIGFMFVVSVILIILITASFILTLINFRKDQKLSERTKNFIDNLAHEFKTPLANISLANNLIIKHLGISKDKIQKYSSIIREENSKLEKQIERVLQTSVIDRESPLNVSTIDVHQIIQNVNKSFEINLEETHGKILNNFNATNALVKGNEKHLSNVFSNIIDNAIKYCKKEPEITITTYNRNQTLVIKISDNGIGIPKESLPFIFERYFRISTGDIHDVKGFGIGLAYVKSVIESWDGKISVESQEGTGSTFSIIFVTKYKE